MVDEIQAGLIERDIARSIFASYCGIPATRLGLCLDGAKAWDPADLAACRKTLYELADLANSVGGVPVDWRKVGQVQVVLETRRAQRTFVVSTSKELFLGLDSAYRPVFNETGIALTGEGAHRVCSELRKLNYQNVRAVERQLLAGEKSLDFFLAWKPR